LRLIRPTAERREGAKTLRKKFFSELGALGGLARKISESEFSVPEKFAQAAQVKSYSSAKFGQETNLDKFRDSV
jgi:hypothetical protein